MPKLSTPITIAHAAQLIGKNPQWLRRHLLKRERETGQRIMIRVGVGPKRTTYMVSLSALREHEPTLFSRRDEVASAIRDAIGAFSERIEELTDQMETLQLMLGKVGDEIREMAKKTGRRSTGEARKVL